MDFRRIVLIASLVGAFTAQADFVPPPGYPYPGVATHMVFDCPEGPGWLRFVAINNEGKKVGKNLFVGSRKDCQAQASLLRRTRSLITTSTLFGVCSASPHYLVRYQIDEWGRLVALPHEYYKAKDECLADAAQLNSNPR